MTKLKIAIFNPYKAIFAAENSVDFNYELITNLDGQELEIKSFNNTEEIVLFAPNFILSHSNYTPKFCHIPTYVIFNEAASHRLVKKDHIRAYLTFDGYLTQSKYIAQKVEDICFAYNKAAHVLLSFANTRVKTTYREPNLTDPKLVYFGNNWEVKSGEANGAKKPRFETLINELISKSGSDFLELYGDKEGWKWVKNHDCIKGQVSFSNHFALLDIYVEKGVGLALSSDEFFKEDLANNRIYEIVASGAICIADNLPFYNDIFGDNILYITSRNEKEMAAQIKEHLEWIKQNPEAAKEKARKAHQVFCQSLCMEEMLKKLLRFHHDTLQKNYFNIGYKDEIKKSEKPLLSVVIRSGGRSNAMVERTLDSVKNQSYKNIEVVFVLYKDNPELENLAKRYKDSFANLIILKSPSGTRSTVMLCGFKAATGDYIALLDDDDIWYPNHASKIIEFFDENRDADFVYSGKVYYDELKQFPVQEFIEFGASNYRDLLFELKNFSKKSSNYCLGGFNEVDYDQMMNLRNPIHLCFVARKSSLPKKSWIDPKIHNAEDLYFCMLLYKIGLKFYWMPELTMQMNLHSANSNEINPPEGWENQVRDRICVRILKIPKWEIRKNKNDLWKLVIEDEQDWSSDNLKIKSPALNLQSPKNRKKWKNIKRSDYPKFAPAWFAAKLLIFVAANLGIIKKERI